MGKGLDTGKAFIQGVLSKITDPELRASAEKTFANEAVLTEIGNGVEGQSEIDRQLRDLKAKTDDLTAKQADLDDRETKLDTWHTNLTGWYESNKEKLAAPVVPKTGTPTGEKPASGLTAEQMAESIASQNAAILGFARDQNRIEREHFQKFGEIPDLDPLLHHPKIADLGLMGVYALVHKDRLDTWTAAQQKAHDDKIGAEAVKTYQASQAQMPYPSVAGAGSGSPLDALTANKSQPVVDAAVAEYTRLQAERLGGPRAS